MPESWCPGVGGGCCVDMEVGVEYGLWVGWAEGGEERVLVQRGQCGRKVGVGWRCVTFLGEEGCDGNRSVVGKGVEDFRWGTLPVLCIPP